MKLLIQKLEYSLNVVLYALCYVFFDDEFGLSGRANANLEKTFERISATYSFFIIATTMAIYDKLRHNSQWEKVYAGITIAIAVISVALIFYTINKLVFKNDKYLRYFKKFEKKDLSWHNKAIFALAIYIIGAIVSFFGSFATMLLIHKYL